MHTHTRTQFANKQMSSTTPGPNVRLLVTWTVKQDRACPTPMGAFLRGQARSGDLGLQRKKDGAALWQNRPEITTTSPEYLLPLTHTHTHTHTHTS